VKEQERYLRFADRKRMGIVTNWPTLLRWIEKEGFPAESRWATRAFGLRARWTLGSPLTALQRSRGGGDANRWQRNPGYERSRRHESAESLL